MKIHEIFSLQWLRDLVIVLFLSSMLIVILSGRPVCVKAATPESNPDSVFEISLLFVGDVMQHTPQYESAFDPVTGQYLYDTCFAFIRSWLSSADLTIANLETTLAGKPYSGYPNFCSPDELPLALKKAGIDILATANNHSCDKGAKGIDRTVKVLDSLGITHFGTYSDSAAFYKNYPLIVERKGIRLAFLNYTYGTNGIPVPAKRVVNMIDKDRMQIDLKKAKDSLPDKIIVFIHWGDEYKQLPNAFQKDIAQFLFSQGADIIIGMHPHVIQPMEWHKADTVQSERITVWSLGNFISAQRQPNTDGGATVLIKLLKNRKNTHVVQANYLLSWVYMPVIGSKKGFYVLPCTQYENDSNFLLPVYRQQMQTFSKSARTLLNKNNVNFDEIAFP